MSNLSAGISIDPKINGGEPCIIRTRIPVWLIIRARQLGSSDGEVLKNYPTLKPEDISNAAAYHLSHKEEIEEEIRKNEST